MPGIGYAMSRLRDSARPRARGAAQHAWRGRSCCREGMARAPASDGAQKQERVVDQVEAFRVAPNISACALLSSGPHPAA